jgi:hypothetical protein
MISFTGRLSRLRMPKNDVSETLKCAAVESLLAASGVAFPFYRRRGGRAGSHMMARPLRSLPTKPAHSFSPSVASTLI